MLIANTPLLNDSTHSQMPGYGLSWGATNDNEFSGHAPDSWSWDEIYAAVEAHEVLAILLAEPSQEMVCQQRDVLGARRVRRAGRQRPSLRRPPSIG